MADYFLIQVEELTMDLLDWAIVFLVLATEIFKNITNHSKILSNYTVYVSRKYFFR